MTILLKPWLLLFIGERKDILNLRKKGKSIRAFGQTLNWKRKELLVCWATGVKRVCSWWQKYCESWKNWKTSVSDITKGSKSTAPRRLREQKHRGRTARCKPLNSSKNWKTRLESTRMSCKSSATQSYGLMRPGLISTKDMGRPNCGERKELLMIWSKQTHLWSKAVITRKGYVA